MNQENVTYNYGTPCNKILTTDSVTTEYIEDSCNSKSMCLYKDLTNYDMCKPVESDGEDATDFLATYSQVENNNFNVSYSSQSDTQYASCSNYNISMISSACYSSTTAIGYPNVSYNATYPIKDMNKNYEEVRKLLI